jgi:hypothetical protein
VAAQVAFSRRCCPHRGVRYLGLAKILVTELPHTLTALTGGRITEWRATLIAQQTGCLSRDHRRVIDEDLAGSPGRVAELEGWSERRLAGELLRRAQELEVESVVERRRRAHTERRVTGRPAPDTMMYLTALLPVGEGVAALAALTRAADTAAAAGDDRSRGQIMADTLVDRLTGRAPATSPADITLNLVITDTTLFADDRRGHRRGAR